MINLDFMLVRVASLVYFWREQVQGETKSWAKIKLFQIKQEIFPRGIGSSNVSNVLIFW